MNDVREATEALLADNPDIEAALEELLAVDEDGPWTFDDLSIDSGTFGEIVSRGIAEKDDDAYRVTDAAAVRAALDGEVVEADDAGGSRFDMSAITSREVDWQTVLIVAGALAFVALVRVVFMWSSVFRGSDIVLAGNDPYFYRYWVDTLLASDLQAFNFGSLSELPRAVADSDVLLIVVLWWTGSLLGDGQTASGLVVAWYPVVAAVVSAGLLYQFAMVVTNDRRIGVATIVTLAVTPAHAYRSALGFGDHHAFDFVWLAVVVLAMALLVVDRSERGWPEWVDPVGAVGLGIGVAAQATAWRGGPILLIPIGGYLAAKVVDDVRANRSPLTANKWLVSGLGLAGVLTLFAHAIFGWLAIYRAVAPALLVGGAAGVVSLGELWVRFDWSPKTLAAVEGLSLIIGVPALWFGFPTLRPALQSFQSFLTSQSNIAEAQSLISGGLGSIFVFGLFLFLALPYLAVATWRVYERSRPTWLIAVVFAWYLLVLSIIQLRFAGELSLFVALFAGVGLVHIAEKTELARPRAMFDSVRQDITLPPAKAVAQLGVLFFLFASLGVVQTPIKMSQISITEDTYETATIIDEHAEQQETSYPENYVFSQWGRNRVHNYHVSGQSRSYGYAEQHYTDFLSGTDLESWYYRLSSKPVGYIVVEPVPNSTEGTVQSQLSTAWRSERCGGDGIGHYQYIDESQESRIFRLVPGSRIIGTAAPNSTVELTHSFERDGDTVTCEQTVEPNPYGVYAATVPHAGTYTVNESTIRVTESNVETGQRFVQHNRTGFLHWPFDRIEDGTAFDRISGYDGRVSGAERTENSVSGQALAFDDPDDDVRANISGPQEFTISMWVRPDELNTTSGNDYRRLVHTGSRSLVTLEQGGAVSFRVPGVESGFFAAGNVQSDEWAHIAVSYNGSHRTIFINGEKAETQQIGEGMVEWDNSIRVGGSEVERHAFDGAIDEFRVFSHGLDEEGITEIYLGGYS